MKKKRGGGSCTSAICVGTALVKRNDNEEKWEKFFQIETMPFTIKLKKFFS